MTSRTSRLAPSPTGALHLGNARTFLINWALARQNDWRLLMRIEDLDGPRVKSGASEQAMDDLRWLGIDYDGPVMHQSQDLGPCRAAMQSLARQGLTYACELTRRQIEQAATAPHANEHELRFPPELRPQNRLAFAFEREDMNYRFVVDDERIDVVDEMAGASRHSPFREVGDFVIWTKRGEPGYQLAVVVDDARQGVTDVVRGDDLLPSAARQVLLYRALKLDPPRWWHLPLVLGPDGRRLAKRHGDTRLQAYRAAGVRAERVIGLLARWSGLTRDRLEISAKDFRNQFSIDSLPRTPVVFTPEDHAWLIGS